MNLHSKVFLQPVSAAARAERYAHRVLDQCINELGLDEVPLPVPVEEWIEHPLGFEFGVEDLSELGDGVMGATFVEEKRIVVDPKVTTHEGRLRFTAAHELGHMVLHAESKKRLHESTKVQASGDPRIERRADRFAAALLMPMQLIVRELFLICDHERINRQLAFSQLISDTVESEWLWRVKFLPAITRRFGVSRQAAMNRFQDVRFRETKATFLPREVARRVSALKAQERPRFQIADGGLVSTPLLPSQDSLF